MISRNGYVTFVVSVLTLLLLLTFKTANAQDSLSITLTCSPLSGPAPFSPSCQFSYRNSVGTVMILVYWGDGSSNDLTNCGYNCPGHSYALAGTYTISISITDGTGRTATDSETITVYSALSITLTVSPLSGSAPFSPSYHYSYDGAVGPVSVVIYWGDTSSNDVTSCGQSCPRHTYTMTGTYTIVISITDSTGRTATDSKTITVYSAPPQTTYSLQVGASGDDASVGNTGVGAEIRTHSYNVVAPDLSNSFWVGDNLQNGAFIQFGYQLFSPGYYCLYGQTVGASTNCLGSSVTIGYGNARWFWQYWPIANVTNFYTGIGPANSAGPDGSWHLYQIWPNVANGWDFVLDGQTVSSNDFQVTKSKDAAYFVAEEVTTSTSASGSLGPVEFRNLTYWTTYGWQQVTSLTAISGCGIFPGLCPSIPYGVSVIGPNDIMAGTGEQLRKQNELLWPSQLTLIQSQTGGLQYISGLQSLTYSQSETTQSLPMETSTYVEPPMAFVPQGPWGLAVIGVILVLAIVFGYNIGKRRSRALKQT